VDERVALFRLAGIAQCNAPVRGGSFLLALGCRRDSHKIASKFRASGLTA
jgi:hypothetical protein